MDDQLAASVAAAVPVSALSSADPPPPAHVLLKRNDAPTADAALNETIRNHAIGIENWALRDVLSDLTAWEALFNTNFFAGHLPEAAISLDRDRRNRLGWYLPRRDGLALAYRVNLNARWLAKGKAPVLAVLLHELLHLEEHLQGRDRGGNYHTVPFRRRALALGIPTNRAGHCLAPTPGGPFLNLLAEHGIVPGRDEWPSLPPADVGPRALARPTSLVPWTCGCTRLWTARGTDLQGRCERCDRAFLPAGPGARR